VPRDVDHPVQAARGAVAVDDATAVSALALRGRPHKPRGRVARYLELTKPRVVALLVFTALVGMLLAPGASGSALVLLSATLGIALAAASGAAFNHILERRSDALMARTRARPLPTGQISMPHATAFAAALGVTGCALLVVGTNVLTAALTLVALVGYSVVYTLYLKPLTPQNIVLGGAAGAAPPLLGWVAVSGAVTIEPVLLFLIVFVWTPPHFWSLALYRQRDYANAGIPMLPVTHGSRYTRISILAYTLVLAVVAALPYAVGMSGPAYLAGSLLLSGAFVLHAWRLYRRYSDALARRTFGFSIQYLAWLFALLLLDRHGGSLHAALQFLGGAVLH
jgi:protoheme IX farnesyltransferase